MKFIKSGLHKKILSHIEDDLAPVKEDVLKVFSYIGVQTYKDTQSLAIKETSDNVLEDPMLALIALQRVYENN